MLACGRRSAAAYVLLFPVHAQDEVSRSHEKVVAVSFNHDGIDGFHSIIR